jgi:peptidyl-prolyl cis-trans isomerase D
MALIGKIRRNFWLVLILLGFALASFVIMDMVGASNRGGGVQADMGSVAGQQIDYREFNRTETALYSGSGDIFGRRSNLWDFFVEKAVLNKQAEGLGLGVSTDELMDLQFGANPSPIIQNNFRNPQTGQLNREILNSFKTAIEEGQEMAPQQRSFWAAQEKQIIKQAVQDKYGNMVSKAMYTPTWMVELDNQFSSDQVSFDYIRIPFSTVDEEVAVSDSEIDAFVKENANKYIPSEDTKVLEYASLSVIATPSDSMMWKESLQESINEFKITDNDSLFATNNNGFISPVYGNLDEVSDNLKEALPAMSVGEIYGPYVEGNSYVAVKIVDRKVLPDSATARHILRSVPQGSGASAFDEAEAYVDSLKTLLRRGVASFDSLAIKNSQDPGSGAKGGDLGTFTQGRMVAPFNDAVFMGNEGDLAVVRTQFGVHLIDVQEHIYKSRDPKYKLAFISMPITPSQDTQDDAFDKVASIVDNNRTLEALETALQSEPGMSLTTAAPVKLNDYIFGQLEPGQNSRDIIKWAFDEDSNIGDVSPSIYTVTDKVNYYNSQYIVVALKGENEAGQYDVASLRPTVEGIIANKKRGDMLAGKINSSDLASLASEYGTEVRSANNVTFSMSSIPGVGREPKVQAAALSLAEGSVSSPIVGEGGVYLVQPTSKTTSALASNVPAKRRTMNNTARVSASRKLIEALKDLYPTEDKRSNFY